ncbi:MAG TPA: hypothetical protein VIY73_25795 [Polyangiaceae bacterium]
MRTRDIVTLTLVLAALPLLACAKEVNRGPVGWSATNPSSPVGQTEAQAWARSTENDAPEPRTRGAAEAQGTVVVPPSAAATSTVELPPGTSFVGRAGNGQDTERDYRTSLGYADTVDFFDRTLASAGSGGVHRSSAGGATFWSFRRADGGRVSLGVLPTQPTSIQVVEPVAPPLR